MKYLKYLKDNENYEQWINSDYCGFPNITVISKTHPNYDNYVNTNNSPILIQQTNPNNPASPNIKSFIIFGRDFEFDNFMLSPCMCDCKTTTFEFEEGMTWEDWVNSKYNTAGFYIRVTEYSSVVISNYSGPIFQEEIGTSCQANDLIIECNEHNYGPLYHFN